MSGWRVESLPICGMRCDTSVQVTVLDSLDTESPFQLLTLGRALDKAINKFLFTKTMYVDLCDLFKASRPRVISF